MLLDKYQNIIFDLDGTLANTGEGIINGVFYAANELNLKNVDLALAKRFVGPPLVESFMNHCGLTKEEATEAAKTFRVYYSKIGMYECELYSGIEETLKGLKEKGFDLYVATSKPEVFAIDILKRLGIASNFKEIVGSNLDNTRSKKNELIEAVIENNHLEKEKCIMVGDKMQDIVGAKLANIDSVGVLYGFGDYEEISSAKPTIMIKRIEELLS